MDATVIVAIIGAVSAVVTGIIGGVVGTLLKDKESRQKIAELKETYDQKLRDGYLEKAREFAGSIYVPLSISLAKLSYTFQNYRADNSKEKEFKDSITEFLKTVQGMSERGANAFLTTELDEKLKSFCSFCQNSITADRAKIKVIFEFDSPIINFRRQELIVERSAGKKRLFEYFPSFRYLGFEMLIQVKEILFAQLSSPEFEERFVKDTYLLNILIKEVTLGAKARK